MQLSTLHRMTTVDEVEATLGQPPSMIMLKQISALDEGCRIVLAHCPLAGFGYRDVDGVSRTTFLGGTPGFARIHSHTRISFTLPDGEAHGPVSFVFLLPGVGETLRVNGSVAKRNGAETFVDVEEAYVHCAQALIRSRLWQPPAPAGSTPEVDGEGPLCGPGVAEFLAAAPFLALSTWDRSGGSDTSPRGDRQTVARILDGRTLVIPDRKGNKRADSLHNLLQDDRLSFAALVPGRTGVLHVSGRGSITDDPVLLETMALRGTPPHAALLIDVEHAEVTASDAVTRSRVWTAAAHFDRGTVPDLMALAGDHLAANMADAERGLLARVLKVVAGIPGISRVLRLVMNRAYRSGLQKEGYEDVEVGSRRGGRLKRLAVEPATENLLREVRIAEVRRETPSAVTLVLEDAERLGSFDFRPGQFFTLVTDIAGRPMRRAYSASSAPGASRLEVTVKQVEGGRFSTHVHRNLRAGDRLSMRGPSGAFHADPAAAHEVVLVAAGSGVTPMMSMIRTLHSLVSMSDDSRNQLLDEFWSEVTDGLTVHPAYVEHLHRMRPQVPEDPTTEQLQAWIQLADLVQDDAFRDSVRQFFHDSFVSPKSVDLTTPDMVAHAEKRWQVELEAQEAERSGLSPESPQAREIAERLFASYADLIAYTVGAPLGEQGLADLRRSMIHPDPDCAGSQVAERFVSEFTGLLGTYLSLMATINETLPGEWLMTGPSDKWIAAALRAPAAA